MMSIRSAPKNSAGRGKRHISSRSSAFCMPKDCGGTCKHMQCHPHTDHRSAAQTQNRPSSQINRICLMITVLALFPGMPLYSQEAYYVQSRKARILSGPSFTAPVLAEVDRGHRFIATGKQENWVKAKYHKHEGYISLHVLSPRPPVDKIEAVSGQKSEDRVDFRRRISAGEGTAARKNASPAKQGGAGEGKTADYPALQKVESVTVSADEVTSFMKSAPR